jgi:hypothetical protein
LYLWLALTDPQWIVCHLLPDLGANEMVSGKKERGNGAALLDRALIDCTIMPFHALKLKVSPVHKPPTLFFLAPFKNANRQ